jgi:glycerol kinase
MKKHFLLAIDQGTTSTRAILFDAPRADARKTDKSAKLRASHDVPLRQIYPANGWVEHDPMEIWRGVRTCLKAVLKDIPDGVVAALGITNQRETSVIWDAATGKPLHNAIVWQDRRGAARCAELKASGWEARIARKTGLLLDPYFSATKLEWLLAHVKGAKAKARRGAIKFGTIDSWLIWQLTGGKVHATDVTNASRTMLFNLKTRDWDDELLELFGVPRAMLPRVQESVADFGMARGFGAPIPILGVAGDQQAASFGQACFSPGDVKATYGTGCFALVNTGKAIPRSRNRLLVTALAEQDYAVEGSIFIAGAVVQWLRDAMGIIATAPAVEALVKTAGPYDGLYFVPAFTGLGAPYWDPQARGAILGLTRDMGKAEVAAAALDAVCYQTRDLMDAMAKDMAGATAQKKTKIRLRELKVDGGMVANDFFCQRLADLTGLAVARPRVTETTALGAALLAGQGAGLFRTRTDIAALWALDRRFTPRMRAPERDALYRGWRAAVARIRAS